MENVYYEMETPIPAFIVLDIRCCVTWSRKQTVPNLAVTHPRLLSAVLIMFHLTQDFIDHKDPYLIRNQTLVLVTWSTQRRLNEDTDWRHPSIIHCYITSLDGWRGFVSSFYSVVRNNNVQTKRAKSAYSLPYCLCRFPFLCLSVLCRSYASLIGL